MDVKNDFKELLELLNRNNVEFLVVGGYALAFHGAPRVTGDLDIYVHPQPENAKRIVAVLNEFGFRSLGLTVQDFETIENIIQLGFPPVRVDFITSIDGVSWEEAWKGKVKGKYADVPVWYIGRTEFIINKTASGRHKDLADIETLNKND